MRQPHASLEHVRTHEEPVERPEQLLDAPIDRLDLVEGEQSAPDPALVRDDREHDAGGTQPIEGGAGGRHRLDARGVPVVGDVADQRPVAIEQHGQQWEAVST